MTMVEHTEPVSWDAAADLAESGGFSALAPEEAFAVVADTVHRPVVGGAPVDPSLIDTASVQDRLLSVYLDATSGTRLGSAMAFGDWVRSGVDADVVPALCRASALPDDTYGQARAARADGDPSLMLDLYSNFMASL